MALELANLRNLPGLAQRPDFPRGLNVLLIDVDFRARTEAEAQLRENFYAVTPCSCSAEAAAFLANPHYNCDVVLADVRCLQQKTAENTAVVQAAKSIPLVLMSESGATSEVMLGIKLGSVDFLEKPLSPLKLKNIWQHLVRRLLTNGSKKGTAAASGTTSPEDSGSHGGPATHSHGSGGESGSHASTSDQALACPNDADMESSFADAMAHMDVLNAHLQRGASHAPGSPSSAGADAMTLDAAGGSSKLRPQALKYRASRVSTPGVAGGSSSSGLKPAVGHPAGQMPPLPAGVPGIEWGLPTNPLQISPKAPMGGLMGPMGWPGAPALMAPPLFSMMMGPPPAPAQSMCTMASAQQQQQQQQQACHGALPLSSSCVALSSCAANNAAASASTLCMKRADSAPLPAMSSLSNVSAATTATGLGGLALDCLMPPPSARPPGGAAGAGSSGEGRLQRSDLMLAGFDGAKPARPPIGLQLKKSASFLDFITETLKYADGSPAC